LETDHFTEFTVAEYEEVDESALNPIIENNANNNTSWEFKTSQAFYLFIVIIIIFGIALIAALIADCSSTTSTLVYPLDTDIPNTIPSEFHCSAMLHLRNPVKLITLNTPNFSRFFRVLFYFVYIFFIYGLSGQLSQHIALFLAIAVIGGFAGLVINVLKGFYLSSVFGKVFSIFFLMGGIAIDATLMRLAPGFTNEVDNEIWMMNAVFAILFDLIISDSIRPMLTLCAFRMFKNTSFANYLLDLQAV
jgi:hypothetical protein